MSKDVTELLQRAAQSAPDWRDTPQASMRLARKRTRRRRTLFATGSAVLIVGVVAGVRLTGTSNEHVIPAGPLPGPTTSVQQTARDYLEAATSQDCETTKRLTVSHTFAWCNDPRMTSFRVTGAARYFPASMAGVDEECVPISMTTTGSSDGSISKGQQPWELCFRHTVAGWRLYDQGMG